MEPIVETLELENGKALEVETPEVKNEEPIVITETREVEAVATDEVSVVSCDGELKSWWSSVSSWWSKVRCTLTPAPATSAVLSSEASK